MSWVLQLPYDCIGGRTQASIVCEDGTVLAFMNLHSANVKHTLVIPREHWETFYDIPEKVLAELFAVVNRVSVAVKKAVGSEGMITFNAINGLRGNR